MMLTDLHTGQTGVQRGAFRAARMTGIPITGFCSYERRDELSYLPDDVLKDLAPCDLKGSRSALRATLSIATTVILAVPDAGTANGYVSDERLDTSS